MLHRVVVRALGMPFLVVAEIPHLDVVFLQVGGLGRQVDGQVGLVDLVVLLQLAQADAAQVDVVVVVDGEKVLVPQRRVVVGDGVAELGLVLAIEHQRDAELGGHLGGQLFLAQDEGLEGVEQVLGSQAGQQAVGHAVGGAEVVVEPGVDPGLHVLPPPGGVDVGRPGDGQRVHTVLVFEQVGGVEAVLAAGTGHQAVVAAVVFAVFIAEFPQFLFPQGPVDAAVGLVVAGVAGVADAVLLDDHRFLDGMDGMLELIAGIGFLVAHDAFFAELHPAGQAVVGFPLFFRQVRRIFAIVDLHIAGHFFHISTLHSGWFVKEKAPSVWRCHTDGAFAVPVYYNTAVLPLQGGGGVFVRRRNPDSCAPARRGAPCRRPRPRGPGGPNSPAAPPRR